jgi:hypothetical protein
VTRASGPRAGRARSVAPRALDGILAAWERYDRRRRGIRPIRPDGVLGLESTRWRGAPARLADGTDVRRGDLVGEIHFDNARIAARMAGTDGRGRAAFLAVLHPGRADLDELARRARGLPPAARPVAYHGATLMWPIAKLAGFEVHERRRTPRVLLDEWFLRWLLVHWSPEGRARLGRGRNDLRSADVWLSARALDARLGGDATPR